MFSSKKLVLGILPVVALSVATAVSSGVQAQVNHNQESIVAIGNKGEELKSGRFESVKAKTSGEVRLVRLNNGRLYLDFDRNFRTEPGPDLFVVLTNENVKEEQTRERPLYYTVSPLLRLKGEQRYILPGDFDPNQYETVAIWCRQQNMILGAATLKAN